MGQYYTVVTEKGIEELNSSIQTNKCFNATKMAVGDSNGNYYEPEKTQIYLKNQKYISNIYAQGKKDDYLYFNLQLPPSLGDFYIREVGLFDDDLNLLAVAKYPETYKTKADDSSEKTLNIEIRIKLSEEAIKLVIINDSGNLARIEEVNNLLELKADKANAANTDLSNLSTTGQAKFANPDLSNLTSTGEKHFLNKSQITNCLLEVPQNIKLELVDGVLTLKAGSKVIVPNGVGKFDEVVIESDLTHTNTANLQMVLCVLNGTSLEPFLFSRSYSGATPPVGSGAGTMLWYDTTNNKMKISTDNGATWRERRDSLPIAIVTADGTSYSSIDRVFNGFGYIGNHIWADKGVKILVANGLNEDGTINNFVMETPFLMSRNAALNGTISFVRYLGNSYTIYNIAQSAYLGELDYIPEITATFQWYFNTNEMKWYMHEANETKWKTAPYYNITPVISATSTAITSFEPYKPFQGVNYSEYKANMDGKVSKSGDTMNGNLTIKKVMPIIDCIGTNVDYTATTAPSSNIFASVFRSLDKNNQIMGQTFCGHTITNNVQLTSDVKRVINGAVKTASLSLIVDASGNPLFDFPKCTTMPTNGGASTASTTRVAVVVENYVNGTSWYRVWSDGWKEQGGYVISATSGSTVSLLKGFTSIDYHVSAQAQITSATAPTPNQIITPYAYTTSNFKVALNYTMNFSWYACGY